MKRPQMMLGALLAGIAAGLTLRLWGPPGAVALADAMRPAGQLWVQGLQMTLVPLVFSMVAGGVGAAVRAGSGARLIGGAMLMFAGLLVAGASLGGATTVFALWLWPLPANALAGLASIATAPRPLPGFSEQLLALVPVNPIATAANGQMMPLVLFAILFGVAATRLPGWESGGMIAMCDDITRIMLTIIGWVLWFAPAGIFVLALTGSLHTGVGLASVLGHFVALEIVTALLAIAVCYALVGLTGPRTLKRFARGVLASQAMAAGSCSSMSTLPVMIEAAIGQLGIPESVAGTLLPLAATSFRFASIASTMVAAMLSAAAAGIHPSAVQMTLAIVMAVLANIGSAGLPGAAVAYANYAPAFQLLDAPLGLIPIYIAAIALPDIFLTTANVTADLTVATLLASRMRTGVEEPHSIAA